MKGTLGTFHRVEVSFDIRMMLIAFAVSVLERTDTSMTSVLSVNSFLMSHN
jgi:cbb3-type cytochrome oxidase subunit 1